MRYEHASLHLHRCVYVSLQVFLKYYHVEQLNLMLREVIARVVLMQAYTKGWLGARRYRKEREKRNNGAVIIQSGSCNSNSHYRRTLLITDVLDMQGSVVRTHVLHFQGQIFKKILNKGSLFLVFSKRIVYNLITGFELHTLPFKILGSVRFFFLFSKKPLIIVTQRDPCAEYLLGKYEDRFERHARVQSSKTVQRGKQVQMKDKGVNTRSKVIHKNNA